MSTVTVDGLAVEINKVASKSVGGIDDMAKAVKSLKRAFDGQTWKDASGNIKSISGAVNTLKNISSSSKNISDIAASMKSLRESFGGTSWKSAPENMKNAAKGIEILRKAIYSIDISRLRSMASILAGIRDAKIKISDAGTIADLEDRIASLNRQIEFLQGKRSGIPEGTVDSIYPEGYFDDESGFGGEHHFSSFKEVAKENMRVSEEMDALGDSAESASKNVEALKAEIYSLTPANLREIADAFAEIKKENHPDKQTSFTPNTSDWKELFENKYGSENVEEVKNTIKSVSELKTGLAKVPGMIKSAFAALPGVIGKVGIALTAVKNAAKKVFSALKKVGNVIKKVFQPIVGLAKRAASAVANLGKSFINQFTEPVKNAIATVEKWKKSLLRIAVYRTMRTAIKELTQSLKEGINNMYEWASLNNNGFKSSMDSIATDVLYIKNSFASALAPAINAIVPIVTRLADMFNNACNAAARFIAIITGQSTYNAAKRVATEYDNGISDAAESAEDLKNTLLGIDELNVLPDASDSSSGSDSGLNYSDMFEETSVGDVPDWLQNIIDAIKSGDWDSAAKTLAQKMNEIIKNWDAKAWAKKFFAKVQKGLHAVLTFLREFDFGEVGKKIAEIVQSFVEEVDPKDVGALIAQKIVAAFKLVKGYLDSMKSYIESGGQSVGTWLSGVVNGWFEEIGDWKSVGQTIGDSIVGVLNNIIDFINGLDSDGIISDLQDLMEGIDFGRIWDKITEVLETTKEKFHFDGILGKAFDLAIDIIDIFTNSEMGSSEKWEAFWGEVSDFVSGVLNSDQFSTLLDKIGDVLTDVFVGAIKGIDLGEIRDAIAYVFERAITPDSLTSFFEDHPGLSHWIFGDNDPFAYDAGIDYETSGTIDMVAAVTADIDPNEFVNNYSTAMDEAATLLSPTKFGVETDRTGNEVASEFSSAAQDTFDSQTLTVTVMFEPDTTAVDNAVKNYTTSTSSSGTSLISKLKSSVLTTKTKKMAKGGIVSSATLFGGNTLVGEAGREAVIPLENNADWMDSVADRIINAMNNQSQQEVVSVSMDGEVFYQQMVKKNRQNRVRTGVNAFA